MKVISCIALGLFFTISTFFQNAVIEESKVYYESKKESVTITQTGSNLTIRQNVYEKKKYNKAVGANYLPDRVYTGYFAKAYNIRASVSTLNKKGKYKAKSIENIQVKDGFSGGTFYDDHNYFNVEYPAIAENAFSELSYDVAIPDEHFLRRFFFTEYMPVKKAKFELIANENIEIGWKIYGLQKDQVKYNKELVNGKVTYSWELQQGEPLVYEDNELGYLHKVTHLVLFIKSYKAGDKVVPVLNSTQNLFEWYQTLIDKISPSSDEELKKITEELIEGSENDLEKAKRIFEWVQDNIRYIAIEDGWRGFIPFPASEICEKRYGDCKDMTHIMYQMMKFAGIRAEHSWIGTRKLPYKYDDTPCPSVDNHLILSAFIDGKHYILDATEAHTPFGIPSTFILGKEALYKNSEGKAAIYQIPSYSAEDCVNSNRIEVTSDGTTMLGKGYKTIETFEYATFHKKYGSANVEKDKFLDEYLELGQNNIEYDKRELRDKEARTTGLFTFNFSLPSYIRNFGNTYYLNLNLTRPTSEYVVRKERKVAFKIPYKSKYVSTVVFTLPAGKQVKELPKDINIKSPHGSCTANFKIDGNKITYNRAISIETLVVVPSEFKTWNLFLKELAKVYGTTIEYE
ncbi:MAG: hypothetical protein CL840_21790 [Crocinitomicaceae bacterium]|nr:hypothetical protein [Crocinitomicaceae bacterium]|tara:strand:- start:17983 stop:19869 length:1887 start_codon:yes stop_codon:yes gene_type:complete